MGRRGGLRHLRAAEDAEVLQAWMGRFGTSGEACRRHQRGLASQGGACKLCGAPIALGSCEFDHVVPVSAEFCGQAGALPRVARAQNQPQRVRPTWPRRGCRRWCAGCRSGARTGCVGGVDVVRCRKNGVGNALTRSRRCGRPADLRDAALPGWDFVMAAEYCAVARIRQMLAEVLMRYLKFLKTDCLGLQDLRFTGVEQVEQLRSLRSRPGRRACVRSLLLTGILRGASWSSCGRLVTWCSWSPRRTARRRTWASARRLGAPHGAQRPLPARLAGDQGGGHADGHGPAA